MQKLLSSCGMTRLDKSTIRHLLLQTRVRTLNGELAGIFKRWYSDLDIQAEEIPMAA